MGQQEHIRRCDIGFLTLDDLAYLYQTSFTPEEKLQCEITKGIIDGQKVVFVKPTTDMSLSGKSVKLVKALYNISRSNIYVVHDDIDLDFGSVKIKTGGSHAGHNGVKSIEREIGVTFHRIRIGVGRPKSRERDELLRFTGSTLNVTELTIMKKVVRKITDNIEFLLQNQWIQFRSKVSTYIEPV